MLVALPDGRFNVGESVRERWHGARGPPGLKAGRNVLIGGLELSEGDGKNVPDLATRLDRVASSRFLRW